MGEDGGRTSEDAMLHKLFSNSDELLLIEQRLETLALEMPRKPDVEHQHVATELTHIERRTKGLVEAALGSIPEQCDTEAIQESRKDMLRRRATIFTKLHQLRAKLKARRSRQQEELHPEDYEHVDEGDRDAQHRGTGLYRAGERVR